MCDRERLVNRRPEEESGPCKPGFTWGQVRISRRTRLPKRCTWSDSEVRIRPKLGGGRSHAMADLSRLGRDLEVWRGRPRVAKAPPVVARVVWRGAVGGQPLAEGFPASDRREGWPRARKQLSRSLRDNQDTSGPWESSVSDRCARHAGAALGKLEIGWLFLHLPALLRHVWLCSIVTERPAWPTRWCACARTGQKGYLK